MATGRGPARAPQGRRATRRHRGADAGSDGPAPSAPLDTERLCGGLSGVRRVAGLDDRGLVCAEASPGSGSSRPVPWPRARGFLGMRTLPCCRRPCSGRCLLVGVFVSMWRRAGRERTAW